MTPRTKLLLAAVCPLVVVVGCGQILSLDDLKVKETELGSSGTAGTSSAGAAGAGAAGTGGSAGTSGAAGGGGAQAGGGAGGTSGTSGGAKPPERPPGEAVPSGKGKTIAFAARTYRLGVTDPDTGMSDSKAWAKFGFDFDDHCTTVDQSANDDTGVCKKANPTQKVFDGDECRDNNFGAAIVTLVSLANPQFEPDLNAKVENGSPTMLLVIDDLDDGKDDGYAPGRLYATTSNKGMATWTEMDVRKINDTSVATGDINKPKVKFSKGYVKDHVWVSGDYKNTPGVVSFPISSNPVQLVASTVVFTIPLDPGHTKVASWGHFGAVLPIDPLLQALQPSLLELGKCGDVSLYQSVVNQSVDIFDSPPTYVGGSLKCNAMSFGAGLWWGRVAVPVQADVIPNPADPPPCDGGM